MQEKSIKLRLGITRPRFNDYLKSKGRRSMSKKRFSKNSLRKQSTHAIYSPSRRRLTRTVNPPQLLHQNKLNRTLGHGLTGMDGRL